MLMQMRKGAGSWVAKIFLVIMALSFVVWGVGDVFRGDSATTAADAGDISISYEQLQVAYSRETATLAQSGVAVEPGSELADVLLDVVLEQLIERALFDQEAEAHGITISQQTVADAIAANPAFHNQSGQFDPGLFPMVLSNLGMSEGMYVANLANQLTSAQLTDSFRAAPPLPDTMVQALYKYRNEERTAELLVVSNDALADDAMPEPGELERYFETHVDTYRAPEYRSADYVLVHAEDLADDILIDEEVLREEYDATLNRWVTPERRTVQQISFDSEEAAQAAHDQLNTASDFETVAAEAGQEAEATELGSFSPNDLFADISEPIFALDLNGFSEPVASPFGGWQIFRVTAIEPGSTQSFEEAREELERLVAIERATDSLFDLINDLDDLLIAGDTLRDAAATLGLQVKTINQIDQSGNTADLMSFEVIPTEPEFLEELFLAFPNEPSPVVETDSGALLSVQVSEVLEARMRDFAEVEDRVLDDWRSDQLSLNATLAAEEIAGTLDSDIPLGDVPAFSGFLALGEETLTRSTLPLTEGADLGIVAALFDADPGDIVVRPSADGNAQVIARLKTVEAANPDSDSDQFQAMNASVAGGTRQAIADQHIAYLRQAYDVNINRELISQRF
ncbi:MAG: peptidylprolyl isomerase [Pseudomonadota bacterium]